MVLQSYLFGYAVIYLAPRKHLEDRVGTPKHIIYYVSLLISVMNVLSWRHIRRGLVTGAIIVISASDKSLPRWVICASDREREQSLALKMKHWYILYTDYIADLRTIPSLYVLEQCTAVGSY